MAQESDRGQRQEIATLARLLGDTIREIVGQETFEILQEIRQLSKERRAPDREADRRLAQLLTSLDQDQLRVVIRAFSVLLDLVNLTEDRQRLQTDPVVRLQAVYLCRRPGVGPSAAAQVRSRAEAASVPGQDHHPQFVVRLDLGAHGARVFLQPIAHRVERLGPVEGDDGHMLAALEYQVLVCHQRLSILGRSRRTGARWYRFRRATLSLQVPLVHSRAR